MQRNTSSKIRRKKQKEKEEKESFKKTKSKTLNQVKQNRCVLILLYCPR
jgi:Pyruvate/2-oxoacid:ferredoxin oxidoreductase delta subunit